MNENATIQEALSILARRLVQGPVFDSPQAVRQYAQLKLGHLEHEVFAVFLLSAQHHLLAFEELFRGTLSQTSVYPREIVKLALHHNAGAVIFTHNHPSGACEPSRADEYLTQTLKTALAMVDVRVLDHIVVSASNTYSMAEKGLI